MTCSTSPPCGGERFDTPRHEGLTDIGGHKVGQRGAPADVPSQAGSAEQGHAAQASDACARRRSWGSLVACLEQALASAPAP
eukprot:4769835-Prymnesium_polylepis.1